MFDKNGIEIKTGNIVEVSGAFFKNDNGLYFVEHSPGDPGWSGRDHCLKKISKSGKISTAKKNICFWPISVFVSSRAKSAEAKSWNAEHATIEVKTIENMDEVAAHFLEEASSMDKEIKRMEWTFGEDDPTAVKFRGIKAFYESIASSIKR